VGIIMKVYLSFGSNLGDRYSMLEKAMGMMIHHAGRCTVVSSIYETTAWGFDTDQNFLNMVAGFETNLEPLEILELIKITETMLGRQRKGSVYESRTIDIDILFYEDLVMEEDTLVIPHPLLHHRNFVLLPLHEIAPDLCHPVLNLSVAEMLLQCTDNNEVSIWRK
jgi:2-amino-4-hydroxy-6-hydroxymethyldihydropteridine diphosphokinase